MPPGNLGDGYWYRPVTSNGAGVYGTRVWRRMSDPELRRLCSEIAERHGELVEIERILQLPSGGRRYWMRTGERWTLYDAQRGPDVRKPWPRWEP